MNRIGIDGGGTNTDAVLLKNERVRHAVKTAPSVPCTAARFGVEQGLETRQVMRVRRM